MNDRLLTAQDVAELLAVPVGWVREHSRNGHLPHIQLGRYVRYDRDDVLNWVQEQKAGGAAWRRHPPRLIAPARQAYDRARGKQTGRQSANSPAPAQEVTSPMQYESYGGSDNG